MSRSTGRARRWLGANGRGPASGLRLAGLPGPAARSAALRAACRAAPGEPGAGWVRMAGAPLPAYASRGSLIGRPALRLRWGRILLSCRQLYDCPAACSAALRDPDVPLPACLSDGGSVVFLRGRRSTVIILIVNSAYYFINCIKSKRAAQRFRIAEGSRKKKGKRRVAGRMARKTIQNVYLNLFLQYV